MNKYLITIKFLGATDRRGSRYKISSAIGKPITSGYDYEATDPARNAVYSWAAQNKLHLADLEDLVTEPDDGAAMAATITPVPG